MNELVFDCYEAAIYAAMILLKYGHYVVMLSKEEQFWVVNYIYSDRCNRNDVVFMNREDFDGKYCEIMDNSRMRPEEEKDDGLHEAGQGVAVQA